MLDIIINKDGKSLKPKFKTGDKVKFINFYNSNKSVYKEVFSVVKVLISISAKEEVSFRYVVNGGYDIDDWPEEYLELVKEIED